MSASLPLERTVPTRVLYVIGSMGVGGAEQHLLTVSGALVREGWQCEVFALDPVGPLRASFETAGVSVIGIDLPPFLGRLLPYPRLLARVRLMLAAPRLLWHLWRSRPQVIHFFLPAAYIIGGIVSLCGPRARRIMSRRSLNLYQSKYKLLRRIEHWLHSKMDRICGNSHSVINDLLSEGVRRERICLTYNGVAMDRFLGARSRSEVRAELGISEGALVFVIVANLIPYKGHADLLNAFETIKHRLPRDWVCLCIGRDDGIENALQDQAERLGITAYIRFLGSRKDVPDLLAAADIGVLCSHEEGFSNAILEGMAAGLPMVVTDVGGNAEAVTDGETGLVVPPHSPDQLGVALLSLVDNPDRRYEMGECGKRRVLKLFSMQACLQAYVDIYRF